MKPRSYGPFPYSPIIDRPRLEWPNGAHVALWIIPNIEYFSMMEKPGGYGAGAKLPDVVMWSERDYGNRVGVFRIMDTLDKYGIRGTVALNSNLCAEHPRIMEEGEKRKWEWMGHNESNTRRLNEAGPGEEAQIVRNTFATIEKATGKRPKGWLSAGLQETWDTLDHLVDNGCQYVADWCNDDQPYQMTLDDGRTIVSMPYTPAAQRQVDDRAALRLGRRLQADDLRPVRRALQGGRQVRPRHGDRAASVPDRRAAPHRRLRCGIESTSASTRRSGRLPARKLQATISRNWMAARLQHEVRHRNARRATRAKQEHGDEIISQRFAAALLLCAGLADVARRPRRR